MNSLHKSSIRYLLRHPWQFGLSILGITMGVAIVVSIDIANHSSAEAFKISMNTLVGKATHQILGGSQGIPDSLYSQLRIKHRQKNIAPVIESYISIPDSGRRVYKLLGVDFFAERPFRKYLSESRFSIDGQLKDFLTESNAIILSDNSLRELGRRIGDSLPVVINGQKKTVRIIGVLPEQQNKSALENLIITDIASAQILADKGNQIDYIDVIINR